MQHCCQALSSTSTGTNLYLNTGFKQSNTCSWLITNIKFNEFSICPSCRSDYFYRLIRFFYLHWLPKRELFWVFASRWRQTNASKNTHDFINLTCVIWKWLWNVLWQKVRHYYGNVAVYIWQAHLFTEETTEILIIKTNKQDELNEIKGHRKIKMKLTTNEYF